MLRMSWHVVITVLSNADKHINKYIEGSCMFMAEIVIFNYYDGAAIICCDNLGNKSLASYFNILFVSISSWYLK